MFSSMVVLSDSADTDIIENNVRSCFNSFTTIVYNTKLSFAFLTSQRTVVKYFIGCQLIFWKQSKIVVRSRRNKNKVETTVGKNYFSTKSCLTLL